MEEQIKNKPDYISLSEASRLSGYTPEHLNLMARKKVLQAEKLGRNWCTTKLWLNNFLVSNYNNKKKEVIHEEKRSEILPVRTMTITPEKIIKPNLEIYQKIKQENYDQKNVITEEAEINFKQSKRKFWRKSFFWLSYSVMAGVIILVVANSAVNYFGQEKKDGNDVLTSLENYQVQKSEGIVKGEAIVNENAGSGNDAALASENYKIRQIFIGGDVAVAASGDENVNPEIQDVHSETYLTKKQDEAKLVITWKTNKLAMSEIEYSKNNGQNPRTLSEGSYGSTHGVLISGLELGTAYIYKIKIRDRWGNEATTGYYAVYGGAKSVSVFDLISQEFEKMFGWAIKK